MKEDTVDMGLVREDTADTADGKNSMNDGAQDDRGWITVKRQNMVTTVTPRPRSFHDQLTFHDQFHDNCVCGIMNKSKTEQRAHK